MMAGIVAWAILVALTTSPPETRLERALVHVESRGKNLLVGSSGERGAWQVMPLYACCRIGSGPSRGTGKARLQFCRRYGAVLAPLWHIRPLCREAGRAILARWLHRSRGDVPLAVRSYNCGSGGLKRKCGDDYVDKVRKRGGFR